jgi:hypothetical protein
VIRGKSKHELFYFFNLPRFAHHADDAASLRNHLWAGSMLLLIPDKNTKSFVKTLKLRVIIKKAIKIHLTTFMQILRLFDNARLDS